jgi:hypothetical protein
MRDAQWRSQSDSSCCSSPSTLRRSEHRAHRSGLPARIALTQCIEGCDMTLQDHYDETVDQIRDIVLAAIRAQMVRSTRDEASPGEATAHNGPAGSSSDQVDLHLWNSPRRDPYFCGGTS